MNIHIFDRDSELRERLQNVARTTRNRLRNLARRLSPEPLAERAAEWSENQESDEITMEQDGGSTGGGQLRDRDLLSLARGEGGRASRGPQMPEPVRMIYETVARYGLDKGPISDRVHVVPQGNNWEIKLEGEERPLLRCSTKQSALFAARIFARDLGGTLLIHRADGQIHRQHNYNE